jgi:hypothetical protein
VRELCAEIGILTPGATVVWKLLGLWESAPAMAMV